VFDRPCRSKSPIVAMAAAAIDSRRGACRTLSLANDHAVFTMPCAEAAYLSGRIDCDASAGRSGMWQYGSTANAQAVVDRPCASNCVSFGMDADDIESSRGL